MKHATPKTLTSVRGLLSLVRKRESLIEKKPGVFYHKSKSVLHFHEDLSGVFADVKTGDDWRRFNVTSTKNHHRLLATLDAVIKLRK